jgi:16S rRNA (uracil1498-N3)-methyltransferase
MRYFFVDPSQIAASRAVIEGAEASHLKNVLRLTRGDTVCLVDGSGFEYRALIDRLLPGRVELSISGRKPSPGVAPIRIDAAQGYLKDQKMDRVVRQLAELGIARFIPLISERAVVRPVAGRSCFRRERWRKISIEALKQCRRGDLMSIEDSIDFKSLLETGRRYGRCILFWEGGTQALTPQRPAEAAAEAQSVLVALGPEGGFSDQEAAAAEAAGFWIVKLGPRILRAETAAVAACAIVQYLYGDLGLGQKSLDKEGFTE